MKRPTFKMPAVASKLTSCFKPKPVFNQPVNTEKRYHISRSLYLACLILLFGLSTATVVLKAITLNFIEDNRNTGFIFETGDEEPTVLAALPRNLHRAPPKLALVAGAVSLFITLGHMTFVAIDWKEGKRVSLTVKAWPQHVSNPYTDSSICLSPQRDVHSLSQQYHHSLCFGLFIRHSSINLAFL